MDRSKVHSDSPASLALRSKDQERQGYTPARMADIMPNLLLDEKQSN